MRETLVALYDVLYGFAPLTFSVGKAPLIAAIIWGFSIYLAVVWTDGMGWGSPFGDRAGSDAPRARFVLGTAGFMMALACFYEPFLDLIGMARWEEGTRTTLGVPWIALVGYPTLTVLFLGLWIAVQRRFAGVSRWLLLFVGLTVLAWVHAWGLKGLKDLLAW